MPRAMTDDDERLLEIIAEALRLDLEGAEARPGGAGAADPSPAAVAAAAALDEELEAPA